MGDERLRQIYVGLETLLTSGLEPELNDSLPKESELVHVEPYDVLKLVYQPLFFLNHTKLLLESWRESNDFPSLLVLNSADNYLMTYNGSAEALTVFENDLGVLRKVKFYFE